MSERSERTNEQQRTNEQRVPVHGQPPTGGAPVEGGPQRGFFDIWSRVYDLAPVQAAIYHPVHDAVLGELRAHPARRILDVGCGTGDLTARLGAELHTDLVAGCDFSAGMLEQAQARTSVVRWLQGDAARLPFGDGRFDAVMTV